MARRLSVAVQIECSEIRNGSTLSVAVFVTPGVDLSPGAPVKSGEVQRIDESYGEGVANDINSESCAVEALMAGTGKVSGSTVERCAQSLFAWLRWMGQATGAVVNDGLS